MLKDFKKIESGVSLVEVVLIMVILGIAVTPLSRLAIMNLKSGGRYSTMTRSISYAQNTMEEIISDYAAEDAGRGYNWVQANWNGRNKVPESGFITSVAISGEDSLNQVFYVKVDVTVTAPDIDNVVLTTWLISTS